MLWPADLEALLAVCMVQAGFEVFAYCDNFLFLEPCNLGLQSFKGSATRRAFRNVPGLIAAQGSRRCVPCVIAAQCLHRQTGDGRGPGRVYAGPAGEAGSFAGIAAE
jgi:hypothetical protein